MHKRFLLPRPRAHWLVWVALCLALVGAIYEERFLFHRPQPIWQASAAAFLILFPAALFVLRRAIGDEEFAAEYPTWWSRAFIIYPVVLAIGLAAIMFVPFAWIFTSAGMSGAPTHMVPGMVASVEHRTGRGCQRFITIAILGRHGTLCAAAVSAPAQLRSGDELDIELSFHATGVYIHSLHPAAPARAGS